MSSPWENVREQRRGPWAGASQRRVGPRENKRRKPGEGRLGSQRGGGGLLSGYPRSGEVGGGSRRQRSTLSSAAPEASFIGWICKQSTENWEGGLRRPLVIPLREIASDK